MKAKLIATFILGIFILASCTETGSEEFCNNPGATCPDATAIEATSCCTDQDCYWIYNGTQYDCNGDDCSTAINTIVASACASAAAGVDISINDYDVLRAQMQAVTNKLLIEARSASGCEY
ncbi:hypothetical protein [uncultured Draconibacterium sp.]|uniref:hypothetical protein n=1 Tax=uncultured Draconibacterium sp. TaxID=1573823 RepID=UPI0032177D22